MIFKLFSYLMKSPLLWGCSACAVFYALLHKGVIDNALLLRYFAGHPVEYFEAILFFVGFAALVIKGLDVRRQRQFTDNGLFGSVSKSISPLAAEPMLNQLDTLPSSRLDSYLIRRFRAALSYVTRNGSAQGLEDELKYLSDMDAATEQQGYALSRIIVWAIPILGFLGTVIGITVAMGELGVNVSDGGDSLKNMLAGLSVAFDTTALALALSMVLMFTQYLVEGWETNLIATVDRVASRELAGRFEVVPNTPEGELTALRRMMETVVESVKDMVAQQTLLWQEAMSSADSQWQKRLEQTSEALRFNLALALNEVLSDSISKSLEQSMTKQNQELLSGLRDVQASIVKQVEQTVAGFTDSCKVFSVMQNEMVQQTQKLVEMNVSVAKIDELEKALNKNMTTLIGSKGFENAASSLAAAVELLARRLDANTVPVRLKDAA